MNELTEKDLKNAQKDRITVKPEEVKFISKDDLTKLEIKFYDNKKDSKKKDV